MIDPLLVSYVVGHDAQKQQLAVALEKQTVPHALLFTGPAGVGKRRFARAVAALLLQADDPRLPLETARAQVLSGSHPDLHLVSRGETQKDLSVEDIRELTHKLQLKPYVAPRTVGIIDDAHTMSIAAANSLLMTLEEPHNNVHLFLLSDAYHKLPPTIVSRCQIVHFTDLSPTQITSVLEEQLSSLSAEERRALAGIARHSMEPLQLRSFVDARSLRVEVSKECTEHLESVTALSRSLQKRLVEVFERDLNDPPLATIMALASDYSEKQRSCFFWPLLRTTVREKLEDGSDARRWATVLEHALEAERLVVERNASPQLQLSTTLLSAFELPS